jgi:starch synthase
VRATGGLEDTIIDFDPSTGEGTGFKFVEYAPDALLACIERALQAYRQPAVWQRLTRTAMRADFSWDRSAQAYLDLYRKITRAA